jgi:hypothetical protein
VGSARVHVSGRMVSVKAGSEVENSDDVEINVDDSQPIRKPAPINKHKIKYIFDINIISPQCYFGG